MDSDNENLNSLSEEEEDYFEILSNISFAFKEFANSLPTHIFEDVNTVDIGSFLKKYNKNFD